MFHVHHKNESDLVQSVARHWLDARVLDHVVAGHVLVLSPHPDDDVFACGGLLTHLTEGGAKIKTLYIFDGAAGNKEGKRDESLIEIREKEAIAAVRQIGHSEVNFLRYKDDGGGSDHLWVRILEEITTRPTDLVLVPNADDWHPDHVKVNEYFNKAYSKIKDKPAVWYYGVWGLDRPNVIFPIDRYLLTKKAAAKCHRSQLRVKKYDEAMIAINEYLGKVFAVGDFAEVYTELR